jgi:uroporphyrinogen decarboxylase
MRGYANAMADLAGNKRLASYLLDRMTEVHMENLRRYLDACGQYLQVIVMGDDMGMQSGPWISRRTYQEMIKPRHSKMYHFIKERCPHVYVFLHSCGSIYSLLPDLIDAGVDIVNPVQTTARDMDPVRLKQEFGKHLTFWGGGLDTQQILPRGTHEQIRRQVEERMRVLGPGGGFVFCQIHNVQADVPPENVVALFDAVAEYRRAYRHP